MVAERVVLKKRKKNTKRNGFLHYNALTYFMYYYGILLQITMSRFLLHIPNGENIYKLHSLVGEN